MGVCIKNRIKIEEKKEEEEMKERERERKKRKKVKKDRKIKSEYESNKQQYHSCGNEQTTHVGKNTQTSTRTYKMGSKQRSNADRLRASKMCE